MRLASCQLLHHRDISVQPPTPPGPEMSCYPVQQQSIMDVTVSALGFLKAPGYWDLKVMILRTLPALVSAITHFYSIAKKCKASVCILYDKFMYLSTNILAPVERIELPLMVLETIALPLYYTGPGWLGWARTTDTRINSPLLYLLSY